MRGILKSRIHANLSDIVLFEAANQKEALKFLKKTVCHLVLFAWEAEDAEWEKFFRDIKEITGVQIEKFLLITPDSDGDDITQALELGIREHLVIPCSDTMLVETITRICNPASLRITKRYSIPGSKALIEQGAQVFQANIINISQGGILCEIDYSDDFIWNEPVMITASFNKIEEGIAVTGLSAGLVRITVLNPNAAGKQKRLRIAYIFQTMLPEVRAVLDCIFAIADKLALDVYDNVD